MWISPRVFNFYEAILHFAFCKPTKENILRVDCSVGWLVGRLVSCNVISSYIRAFVPFEARVFLENDTREIASSRRILHLDLISATERNSLDRVS